MQHKLVTGHFETITEEDLNPIEEFKDFLKVTLNRVLYIQEKVWEIVNAILYTDPDLQLRSWIPIKWTTTALAQEAL